MGRGVKIALTYTILAFAVLAQASAQESGHLAMFWNLENFFDWKDGGGGGSDRDFSSSGNRHWTSKRFYAKCNAVAKSLLWIADGHGKLPDVVGFAEIENRDVLSRLINSTALCKTGYKIIHYDSPDHRGIDVAMLWNPHTMELLSSKACRAPGMETRDLLLVRMKELDSGREKAFITVHLPSKYGGGKTAWKREKAAARLREVADSVYSSGCMDITVMGDFNDTPDAEAFSVLGPLLVNVSEPLFRRGLGTIRFEGKWDLIDMFWVTSCYAGNVEMEIVNVPFLMVRDNVYSGEKPLRTYSGPRYLGGVSDHCPVLLKYW